MRTKIRSFAPLLAAAGVGRCHRVRAGRRGATPMRDHRSEHHAVPDQRQRTDRHLTPAEQQLGLAVGRRPSHRLRRLGLGLVTARS